MNKQCPECKMNFPMGRPGFDMVRLIGMCGQCANKRLDPLDVATKLKGRRSEDKRLGAIGDAIRRGVEANATSGPQQLSLLTIIRYGPCTVGEVAEYVGLDQSSITLQVKKFELEGLIEVKQGADRRRKIVEATPKARSIYKPAHNGGD